MNIIVCDDDSCCRKEISASISTWKSKLQKQISISTYLFFSTEELLEAWQKNLRVDLLFFDIEIPGEMSGLDLAKIIRQNNQRTAIVFVTNYAEYAYDGYSVNALRYLKKPVSESSIHECIDIAFHQWEFLQDTSIFVESQREIIVLPLNQLIYIESNAHYLVLYRTIGDPLQIRQSISVFFEKLPSELFARCHRSFVVNLSYVRRVSKTDIALAGGFTIPVGAKFTAHIFQKVNQYYQGYTL